MTEIRALRPADVKAVVELSVRAWAPVHESFADVLGQQIYRRAYPDWQTSQAAEVREVCADEAATVLVAVAGGVPVGFSAVVFHEASADVGRMGEIDMIAVDPAYQRRGIAAALTSASLEVMTAGGCTLAVVATGGDPGHAPARATYEKANFAGLPLVRYYRAL